MTAMRLPWRSLPAFLLLFGRFGCLEVSAAEPELLPGDLPHLPAVEPVEALATFEIRPGLGLELAAAEPEVMDPVAVCFDEVGRLYVVEMRDYSERRPERLGRVRRLQDRDGDGRFETSQVFLEGLPWPTAITCWDGGVFVGATPDLIYARDSDGDGRADLREVVFSGFASDAAPYATNKLNVQAMMNSLQWGLDARIHGSGSLSGGSVRRAESAFVRAWRERARERGGDVIDEPPDREWNLRGRDFSFDPLTLDFRTEFGGGQHGMTFDAEGRKFVCSNSDHLQWIRYEERHATRAPAHVLPVPRVSIAADGPAAEVFRISPVEPWRIIRTRWRVTGLVPGLIEGGGRASGYFTSATGLTIYRGDALGRETVGDAFVADCGSNLIHRKRLRQVGCEWVGERPPDEQTREFIASRDTWFRPVDFANAPDGCLWVIDMYREIIEHPWSLPSNLKRWLDLNSGNDRGRLYRVVPAGRDVRRRVDLSRLTTPELVATLGHANGWHRETASRLLCEKRDPLAVPLLRSSLGSLTNDAARLQALYVLESIAGCEPEDLALAITDPSPAVRRHGVRLAELHFSDRPLPLELDRPLSRCADDAPEVRLQLALGLAALRHPQRIPLLVRLVQSAVDRSGETLILDAALAASGEDAMPLFRALMDTPDPGSIGPALSTLAGIVGSRGQPGEIAELTALLSGAPSSLPTWRWASHLAAGARRGSRSLGAVVGFDRLRPLLEQARRVVLGPEKSGSPVETQVEAIRFMAELPPAEARSAVLPVLDDRQPIAAQKAALDLVLRDDPGGWEDVLGRWDRLSPEVRAATLDLTLRRTAGSGRVLDALALGKLSPKDFLASQLAALRRHSDGTLRRRAVELLGDQAETRGDAVASMLPALNLRGDPERGRAIHVVQCAQCHRLSGEGTALGPDLESVQSQPKEKLLVAIVDPNREVAPAYLGQTVETTDEESLTGFLVAESPAGVTIRQAGGVEVALPRERIRSIRTEARSLMPEGFETTLTPQQFADLLAAITGVP